MNGSRTHVLPDSSSADCATFDGDTLAVQPFRTEKRATFKKQVRVITLDAEENNDGHWFYSRMVTEAIVERQSQSYPRASYHLSPYFSTKSESKTTRNSENHTPCAYGTLENSKADQQLELKLQNIPLSFINAYISRPILIQEQLASNPWRLLIATILLNKTTGKAAIPVFWELMKLWPTPMEMALAPHGKMTRILTPLGFGVARALWLTKFSLAYETYPPVRGVKYRSRAKDFVTGDYPPTEISHLPNMGKYALDSYRIFCCDEESGEEAEWMRVRPKDKVLEKYLKWKWAFLYHLEWTSEDGVMGPLSSDRFADLCGGRW